MGEPSHFSRSQLAHKVHAMLHSRCQWVFTTQPRPAILRPLLDTLALPLVSRQKTSEVQKMMPSWHTMPSLSEPPLGTLVQMSSAQALAGTNGFMIISQTSTSRARRSPFLALATPVHTLITSAMPPVSSMNASPSRAQKSLEAHPLMMASTTQSPREWYGNFVGQVFDE